GDGEAVAVEHALPTNGLVPAGEDDITSSCLVSGAQGGLWPVGVDEAALTAGIPDGLVRGVDIGSGGGDEDAGMPFGFICQMRMGGGGDHIATCPVVDPPTRLVEV